MSAVQFSKRTTPTYTGKETGTAKDGVYLSVASFGCDDDYATEDMATQATTTALPG